MCETCFRSKKLPRNYQLVFDVVASLSVGQHAAAGEVYEAARRRQPGLGYSTVYRALNRLTQLGMVLEVSVPGQSGALYEPSRGSHAHFSCQDCGRIVDVDYAMPTSEVALVAQRAGLQIADASVTFVGRCDACLGSLPAGATGLA